MNTPALLEVYKGITAVSRALARAGISKDRKNAQQGYNFRGIDDIYNALSSELAAANLCIIPRVMARESVERQTRSGGALFYVTVHAEYDIVSAIDGSCHTASAYGEAMDSADKATNKAMSAAYKYMAMQLFCIPTEGDNDADATTHEIRSASYTPPAPKPAPAANGDTRRARIIGRFELTLDEARKCGIKVRDYTPERMTDDELIAAGTELKTLIDDSKKTPVAERL